MLDDSLDRGKTGSAGDQDDWLIGFLAQEEGAERPLEAQDLAALELTEQLIGEMAAGHMADVQFQQRVVVRRRGERETAASAVLQ